MREKKDFRVALVALFGLDFGARSVGAYLKSRGYSADLVLFGVKKAVPGLFSNDCFNAPAETYEPCGGRDLELLLSLLEERKPDVIGISLSSTTFKTAREITLAVKKRLDAVVVWGGVHAVICPEECIRYADIVCVGEGELPMLELADRLREGKSPAGIANLWIRTGGGVEKNALRPLLEDLDSLPYPDFCDPEGKFIIDGGRLSRESGVTSSYERGTYPLMTSRGCLYACAFCSNSVLRRRYEGKGPYLRRRSVDSVLGELSSAAELKPFNRVRFWDDIFTYDPAWINEFCSRYLREVGKPFSCYTHPSRTDRDILVKLRRAGLTAANIGLQSGSEELSREVFGRAQSNGDLAGFAAFADTLGVTVRYDVIADNPYETDEDERRTAELLLGLPYPFQAQIFSLCWFPGTPLTERALAEGTIAPDEVEQLSSKALNNFYMHLPLSRGRSAFFWNCIKAMAVNRLFPPGLVRACMASGVLRRWPGLLRAAGKLYLRLLSRYSLALENGRPALRRKTPCNFAGAVAQLDGAALEYNIVMAGRTGQTPGGPPAEFSLLPPRAGGPGARLKIRRPGAGPGTFDLLFLLTAFDDFYRAAPLKTLWRVSLAPGEAAETEIALSLSYPALSCRQGEKELPAQLLERGIVSLQPGRLYSLALMQSASPGTRLDTLLFEA